jgi:hypothetical protein
MKNFFTLFVALIMFSFSVNAQYLNLANADDEKERVVAQSTDHHPSHATRAVIWSEDFEGGALPAGWSESIGAATQGWTFNTDAGSQYFPVPAHTTYAAVNDDECDCDMSDMWLITSEIDLSTATTPMLGFESYLHIYSGTFTLKASIDAGTTWADVTTFTTEDAWTAEEVDLTAYAGEMLTLAFHFNDGGAWDYGWAIDDVVVFEPEAHDMAVVGITPSIVLSGETVAPTVTIENLGGTDEAIWSVQLTDGVAYDETIADGATVTVGGTHTITFPDWTPADGDFTLTAILTLTDDADLLNNELSAYVTVADFTVVHGANSNEVSGIYYLGTPDWATAYASGVSIYGGTYITDKLYGITDAGAFGYFDAAVETWTEIGATGIAGESFVISMAYDPVGGGIYTLGLSGSYPEFQVNLYSIDMASGAATLVATSPQTGTLLSIACSANGTLYGIMHTSGNGALYTIDKTDASMTMVGDMGVSVSAYFQSMAFDFETNTCYFQAFDDGGGMNGSYMIDITTAAPTMIGTDVLTSQLTALGIPYSFVAVDDVQAESNLSVFPNPAKDNIYVNDAKDATISVINMMGQVVISEVANSNTTSINISDLAEGTYIIRITNGNDISTQKINIVK